MKLYSVTFIYDEQYLTEFYMADSHDHAEEQCKNANPPTIGIVSNVRMPFHQIEYAYLTRNTGKPNDKNRG